jgi:ribosome-binding protein aMBF1 (putative translation factor)
MSASTVARASEERHHVLPESAKAGVAKANLRIPEMNFKRAIGGAIQRAVALVGWSNKEAAAKVGTDDSSFGKWISGAERPQFDRLFAVEELRWPLIQALAQLDEKNEIVTTIRRTA